MATVDSSEDFFTASDGAKLFVRSWAPAGGKMPRAVMHLHHGLGDHSGRYARLAQRLVDRGLLVIAHDARGHGRTADAEGSPGLGRYRCGPEGAVARMVLDFQEILLATTSARPGLPILVLGHSFGTIISHLCLGSGAGGAVEALRGVVLCACPARLPTLMANAFAVLMGSLKMVHGEHGTSRVPGMLTFDKYNKQCIKAAKHTGPVTNWEWLNRDVAEVQKYIDDPHCGFDQSMAFWTSAIPQLKKVRTPEALAGFPKGVPVCLLEGSHDFCAIDDFGKKAHECVQEEFVVAGKGTPKVHYYTDARHELLLETNREEIYDDVVNFCMDCLERPAQSKL